MTGGKRNWDECPFCGHTLSFEEDEKGTFMVCDNMSCPGRDPSA